MGTETAGARRGLGTPEEVAEYLRLTTKTLDNQRYQRIGIPFVKVGGVVRYRWRDVEAYIEAQTVRTCDVQAPGTARETRTHDRGCPVHGDREPAFPGAPVRGDSVRGPGAQAG